MNDLIEALKIFVKYGDPVYPTHCEHDILYVCIDQNLVSEEDKCRLRELHFYSDEPDGGFYSHRFGSA